jgi:hypothetical protein
LLALGLAWLFLWCRVEVVIGGGDAMREPVAMEIPAQEGPGAKAPPRRIRMRLMEGARGGGAPASVEEIEARLREAELRRQVGVPFLACFFFGSVWFKLLLFSLLISCVAVART